MNLRKQVEFKFRIHFIAAKLSFVFSFQVQCDCNGEGCGSVAW